MSNRDIHEVEEPKGGDEKAFKAKHKVKVTDYPDGTKVPPITTKKVKRIADPVDTETTYEETEITFSIFWRDANGMDKQKHGLSEEEVTRLATVLEAAGSVKIFIDEEEKEMSDEQKKKREDYVKGMKSKSDDLRKRYGKRWRDVMYAIATKNAMKEDVESLDEIAKSEEEPLHVQLRKRTNANEVSVTFKNGKTHVIPRGHANKALTMLSGMKPADRQHAHGEMSKSHEHFMDALEGKMSAKPGKTSISLGGNYRKEEVEELDENHRVGVTYSDPNSSSVTMRKEKQFKQVKVKAASENEAIAKAKKHFKNNGYRVHDATITTMKEEVEALDEISSGLANDAYHSAMDKSKVADIMQHTSKGKVRKKWKSLADKRYSQADKFASYSDNKKMKEEVESLDEVGGQTSQVSALTPPNRPAPKPVVKKAVTPAPTTVKEAGDVIPPKTSKMKSFSDSSNNFKLDKPRAKSYNVPTMKDRSLEMDEEAGVMASKLIEKYKAAEEERRLEEQSLYDDKVVVVDVFNAGEFKLEDNSIVVINEEQAEAMNELFHSLSLENKGMMLENIKSSKESYLKVLSFATGVTE